jgi:hypothetical protein
MTTKVHVDMVKRRLLNGESPSEIARWYKSQGVDITRQSISMHRQKLVAEGKLSKGKPGRPLTQKIKSLDRETDSLVREIVKQIKDKNIDFLGMRGTYEELDRLRIENRRLKIEVMVLEEALEKMRTKLLFTSQLPLGANIEGTFDTDMEAFIAKHARSEK